MLVQLTMGQKTVLQSRLSLCSHDSILLVLFKLHFHDVAKRDFTALGSSLIVGPLLLLGS